MLDPPAGRDWVCILIKKFLVPFQRESQLTSPIIDLCCCPISDQCKCIKKTRFLRGFLTFYVFIFREICFYCYFLNGFLIHFCFWTVSLPSCSFVNSCLCDEEFTCLYITWVLFNVVANLIGSNLYLVQLLT